MVSPSGDHRHVLNTGAPSCQPESMASNTSLARPDQVEEGRPQNLGPGHHIDQQKIWSEQLVEGIAVDAKESREELIIPTKDLLERRSSLPLAARRCDTHHVFIRATSYLPVWIERCDLREPGSQHAGARGLPL